MLPQYERLGPSSKPLIQIPFGRFAVGTVCFPFFALIFCIIWSILFFFEESTSTHCNVRNYLPSISAAIGNYQPQKFVWQAAICIQLIPRFTVTKVYHQFYEENIKISRIFIAYIVCLLNVIENIALLGLSLFTSADSYELHKFCFTLFILISEFYMLVSYILNKNWRKLSTLSNVEQISITIKRNLFFTNIIAFVIAIYLFARHNMYCEPGVYTMFAFFEYIVVLSNMGYHMTAFWDFYGKDLAFDWYKGLYLIS